MTRRYLLSINRNVINKTNNGDAGYIDRWENVELTADEFTSAIRQGFAYCAQLRGRRQQSNFLASDLVSVDIDRTMALKEVLQHPLVRENALLVYTTASHTDTTPHARIVFATPRTLTDPHEMRALSRSLGLRLNGDPSVHDPARLFFGNQSAETFIVGRTLSRELVDELAAQSANLPEPDRPNGWTATSRSPLMLNRNLQIRLADGREVAYRQLPRKATLHCPFHDDRRPSAFVVTSRTGTRGIRCARCETTFWPENATGLDPEDFDQAVHAVSTYFDEHGDPGPLDVNNRARPRTSVVTCGTTIVNGAAAPPALDDGVTFIKSAKGSGKTAAVRGFVFAENSALLIGHRIALIDEACERIGLVSYRDSQGHTDVNFIDRQRRLGICLDSLLRVPPDAEYDLIILDESEQVLAHVLSETIERREGGSRDAIFQHLTRIIRRAKRVVALDADLSFVTFDTLMRMRGVDGPSIRPHSRRRRKGGRRPVSQALPKPPAQIFLNEARPGRGKTIQVYENKNELVLELESHVAGTKRCFVACNTKRAAETLASGLQHKFPDRKVICLTADTRDGPAQQEFLRDAKQRALDYDVIVCSPVVGTGIDITFPNNEQRIDAVFGFCEPKIASHFDFDQQLGRVRHPREVKVWVTPQTANFETNPDAISRELLQRRAYRNLLVGYEGPSDTAVYKENDPLIAMAALVIAKERGSKNELRRNFILHKEKQGYQVEIVPSLHMHSENGAGADLLQRGKELSQAQYVTRILAATAMTREQFEALEDARRQGQSLDGRWQLERTRLERFYRRTASAELIAMDKRGRYREACMRYAGFLRCQEYPSTDQNEPLADRDRFLADDQRRARALTKIIRHTGLVGRDGEFDPAATVDGRRLQDFIRYMESNKSAVENLLSIEVRRDIATKPVRQLNEVLGLMGLKVTVTKMRKEGGERTRQYQLDTASLDRMRQITRRRQRTSADDFSREVYGWPEPEPNGEQY